MLSLEANGGGVDKDYPKSMTKSRGSDHPEGESCIKHGSILEVNLLNVEGKLFFSTVANRLTTYLKQNNLIDTSVQKAGIFGFSGKDFYHRNRIKDWEDSD